MKKKQMIPIVLAVIAILMATSGLFSYGWYSEHIEIDLRGDKGNIKTDLGYGIRGVSNYTVHRLNGTILNESDKVHTYDEFIGEGNMVSPVVSTMSTLLLIGILMAALFIPMAYLTHTGGLEDRVGKWAPYIPLYVAQVSAITLIIAPMWFSYEFTTALDIDMMGLTNAPSQALGDMAAWWVIFGGVLIQVAAFMAISRTKLIYIEPLDEVKTPEPME